MNIEMYIQKDYNHVLVQLQDYMLSRDVICSFFKEKKDLNKPKESIVKEDKEDKEDKKKMDSIFYPREKDSLFWCFYIITNGFASYQMIPYKNIVVEKKFKIEYVEKIRKEKQRIKPYKFAGLQNMENNLAHDFKIDANTFLTLCVIENINVLLFKKRTYYELLMNDSDDFYIVKMVDIDQNKGQLQNKDKYGFQKMSKKEADEYKKQFLLIENIEKPIKSITYYKVNDLLDMCNKLGIVITDTKRKSKQHLYETIVQQL